MTRSVAVDPARYLGDSHLAELLARARAGKSVADVRSLIAGVLAAPEDVDPDMWLGLVTETPGGDLARQLQTLKQSLEENAPCSLEVPAPAWRLKALRHELQRTGLDGFVVPHADEHQGEMLPARSERLAWLTGFNGSAGVAVVLNDKAAIFVDGRYTLQVRTQVNRADFDVHHLMNEPPHDWISDHLEGGRLGYDPWLHGHAEVGSFRDAAERAGGTLVPCDSNPIDQIWFNQPPPPLAPVRPHALEFAGETATSKIDRIAASLAAKGHDGAVISDPTSIAWLLNIRGGDLPGTPVCLGFAIVSKEGLVTLFADQRKFTPEALSWLPDNVSVQPRDELNTGLAHLAADGAAIVVDRQSGAAWLQDRIEAAGGTALVEQDPCALPRAIKNAAEVAGMANCHVRDGAALTKFLCWLDHSTRPGSNETVDEMTAERVLEDCRRRVDGYRGYSFETISGSGPNGAVVHYRSSEATNRTFEPGSLYLVDSGGQYPDGTTDVTRTIAVGEPDADHKRHFTAVLKGHIALATARFPKGTTGTALDTLARSALWKLGADYDHGTGHGVGSHLGVHEGPQNISKRGHTALEPGMILSNEPGYYRAGAWGIRIENLVVVEEDSQPGERPMLRFSTLTRAPIDRRLVNAGELTDEEADWLDAYHANVRESLGPLVDSETAAWLDDVTRPIRDGS
ncbi:MAG: aminopeptidase P family protein [Alphaproteobacteria bacterium]|nr:aminopeptidase P family protein [Alphaproteobacteria bacterium]